MLNKRGQITIFIILAVLIVAGVVLFFIFKGKSNEKPSSSQETINPESFLKSCIDDKVRETLKTLSYQGGYIKNPLSIKFKFGSEPFYNISYLCYTSANYLPCAVQQPSLITHIEKEIYNEIKDEMQSCFDNLVDSYGEKDYSVDEKYNNFAVDLVEDRLKINLDATLTLTKTGEVLRKKDFKMNFPTELYDVLFVSNEIISQEAKYCSFNYVGYMMVYQDYEIDKQNAPQETRIYSVTHKITNEKFRFATRSCVPSSQI